MEKTRLTEEACRSNNQFVYTWMSLKFELCGINFLFFSHSTRLLAATTLRNVLGTKNLSEILSERDTISNVMKTLLDEATDPWGVRVERVEVKDVRLPVQLQRAMAAEAEAAREARAKVRLVQGELEGGRN